MRLLVVSDTHGDADALRRLVERQRQTVAGVIHLGDGCREAAGLETAFPGLPVWGVRGNCDWGAIADEWPLTRLLTVGGYRIFCTHGQAYAVKYGLTRLALAAAEQQADLVLFGHTHQPFTAYEDQTHFLNPGSLGQGYPRTWGWVDLLPGGIVTRVVEA
ncbi:MAG: metallophosphoesterase family protein [Acutalibacteraceae bacterium]|jgi:putative phosphoesterase